jgi:hypothetical protein
MVFATIAAGTMAAATNGRAIAQPKQIVKLLLQSGNAIQFRGDPVLFRTGKLGIFDGHLGQIALPAPFDLSCCHAAP